MTTTEIQNRIGNLKSELERQIRHYRQNAIGNHWLAIVAMMVAIGTSFAASLAGFLGANAKLIGGLALGPATCAIIATTFRFQARSLWHYRKKDGLDMLRHRLLFQLPESPTADNVAAISRDWEKLTDEMQKEWENNFTFNWTGFLGHGRTS